MSPSFNLLTQPWIPSLPLDSDKPILLSLPDTLAGAHQHRGLVPDSPLVGVALHRLLLAVIHRTYMGPRNADEWHALWNGNRFDTERVRAYLLDPRWHSHFDLFDGHRPFYQTPTLEGAEPISVAKLALERASGNNITLFDHTIGATAIFTPAEAARNLAAFQVYAMGGGVSDPFNFVDAPLARDFTVLVQGTSLFETLMLNLLRYDDEALQFGRPLIEDSAWWERDRDAERDKRGPVARRLKEPRAVWRDSHTLLEEARNDGSRPEIFAWLGTLFPVRGRSSARAFTFEITGYLTDGPQGPVILWRHERLPLPQGYLSSDGKPLRDELSRALQVAEQVGRLFGIASIPVTLKSGKSVTVSSPVWLLAKELLTMNPERTLNKQRKKDVGDLVDHFAAERTYWAQMEPPFRRLMVALADEPVTGHPREEHFDAVLAGWKEEIRLIARRTFSDLVSALESDVRSLRAAALAQRRFSWLIKELLPTPQKELTFAGVRQKAEAHQ